MKQEWSRAWSSSSQPRKQRKFRFNAPLHIRHRFLSAHLTEDLRREVGRRSLPVRKGDEVRVMRGSSRGFTGVVDSVDVKELKVYVDGIKVKKVDGSEVLRPLSPSTLLLTKLNLDDKWRKGIIERKKPLKGKPAKEAKKEEEPTKEGKGEKETKKEKPVKKTEKKK